MTYKDTPEWLFGQWTENLITNWLKRQGFYIIPNRLIERGGAPMLEGWVKQHVLPDITIAGDGHSRLADIKGKAKMVHHRISNRHRTGIGERPLRDYRSVAAETGLSCWLVFFHNREKEIDMQSLEILGPGIIGDPGHERVFGEAMRFWELDRFQRYQVNDEEIAKIADGPAPVLEPKAEHPWKEPQAPSTLQDGFSFVQNSEFEACQNYLSHTRRCKSCDPSNGHVCMHGRQLHDEWKRAEQAQG